MKYITLLSCMLLALAAHAQTIQRGTVTDALTGLPMHNVVVSSADEATTTDANGNFSLKLYNAKPCKIEAKALGYKTAMATCKENGLYITMQRNYTTLSEVEITAKGIGYEEIMRRVLENKDKNYLPTDVPLVSDCRVRLYKPNDTALDISRPVYLYDEEGTRFSFKTLYVMDSGWHIRHNKLTTQLKNDYTYNIVFGGGEMVKNLRKARKAEKTHRIIISTFYVGDERFYDILIMTREPQKVKYNLLAKVFGYGTGNTYAGNLRYVGIMEMQVNASNYALTFMRTLKVGNSDENLQKLVALTGRNEIDDWIAEANAQDMPYSLFNYSFAPDANKRYALNKMSWRDNLLYIVLKNKEPEPYVYEIEHRSRIAENIPDVVYPFSISNQLLFLVK